MWLGDKQPASAMRAAHLVWELGHCSYPPLRLILGTYTVENVRDRLKCIFEEIEDWKHLNFPLPESESSTPRVDADGETEVAAMRVEVMVWPLKSCHT